MDSRVRGNDTAVGKTRRASRPEILSTPAFLALSFSCFAPKRDHDEWLGRGAVERESSRSLVGADTVIPTA